MTRRGILACALAAGLMGPALALAERTRTWRQADSSEFEKGTAKGVAIRSDGKLMPAPKFTLFSDSDLAYLWALRMDSRGRLFAAGGSDAKVLRFDDAGKPTTVFESAELAAQAIAFDARDNLYVGTSPDGKVYKVTPDGQKSVFFEPKTKYIWALAVDSAGALFVATGDKGEVFVVNPDGKGQLFYQSDERHARSLAFDAKGNLLMGTDPNGLILRIEVTRKNSGTIPEAGTAFVIYETAKKEVTSLVTDAKGNVYAASIGDKPHAAGATPAIALPQPQAPAQSMNTPSGNVTLQLQAQAAAAPAISFPSLPSPTGGAEVVKILPDGSPETLWTSHEELVFAVEQSPAGNILLGTGNKGAILSLEGNNVYSTIAKTASAQVTSLIAGPDGKIFVATANPGKIFTLGPGYDKDGSFESETFDAKIFSHWGRLTWWGENGATQGKIAFYVRTGNTSSPEKNWSPWAGPYTNTADATVKCPPARFAQWKAVFVDTDHGGAPSLSWVSLAYQPKNVAPVIDDIVIQEPGVRVQGFAAPAGIGTPANVQLHLPQRAGATFATAGASGDSLTRPPKLDVAPQGFEDKGWASVLWSAHDDNEDELVYSIYYHGEGEQNWRLLKDKLTQKFYSWDTTAMPDGAYYLKIVASDSPSNPPSETLSSERESDRLEIENTPPRVENLRAEATAGGAKVTFEGISSTGTVARAQYSVDAGDWLVAFPTGLLSDAPKESYELQLAGLAAGEHTIAVQIADRFENTAAAKVTFTVAPGAKEHGK